MGNPVQKAVYFLNFTAQICNEGGSTVIVMGYAES